MNIEIIISSSLAVVTAITASFIWEKVIRDRVSARRITSPRDKDLDGLIELYLELFPDGSVDYSANELRDIFEKQEEPEDTRHVDCKDILLIAKCKGAVIGFLFCHYYPSRKKAIISYFGINNKSQEARNIAANVLLNKLNKLLNRTYKKCEYLFFDVARPDQKLSKKENFKRKARIERFLQSARTINKKAYVFRFEYHSPRVSMAEDTHERPLVLMFIPLKEAISTTISKVELMSFLKFIYLDCYGDIYRIDDPRFDEYQKHLRDNLSEFEEVLPESVQLSCNALPNNWN